MLAAEGIVSVISTPIAVYPPPDAIAYHIYLEILTPEVDKSSAFASRVVYDLGGYVENSNSWYVGNQKYTSLDLSIPAYNYEALRAKFAQLGVIVNETAIPEPIRGAPSRGIIPNIKVTLKLDSTGSPFSKPPNSGWNPLRTLQSA